MNHSLTIRAVTVPIETLHGLVPLLSGYVGECGCGQKSPLYGAPSPIPLWHEQHTDPTGRRARAKKRGVR